MPLPDADRLRYDAGHFDYAITLMLPLLSMMLCRQADMLSPIAIF